MKYYQYLFLFGMLFVASTPSHADLDKEHEYKLLECFSFFNRQSFVYKSVDEEKYMLYKNKVEYLENMIIEKYSSSKNNLAKYSYQWSQKHKHLIEENGELEAHLILEYKYKDFCDKF